MKGKNFKEHHSARGIPTSGAKGMPIEWLTKAQNDNVVVVSPEK